MRTVLYLSIAFLFLHIRTSGQELAQEMVNAVSADSLMQTIRTLESYGTRYEYTPQRDSAGAFLLGEFSRLGLQAISDWYTFGTITLYDIASPDSSTLFLVGQSGALLASTDGGEQWDSIAWGGSNNLYSIAFATREIGCIGGSSGMILRTTDGGSTWSTTDIGVSEFVYSLAFANDTLGIAAGSNGLIMRTTDGGAHWSRVLTGTQNNLRWVEILNDSTFFISGDQGTLLRSTNAGLTWTSALEGSSNTLYGIGFSSALRGYAVGTGPSIFATTDGGATWTESPEPPDARWTFRSISFQDSALGWMVDYYGKLFETRDGGTSWSVVYDHASGDWGPFFARIRSLSAQRVYTCGTQGILLTRIDGGVLWKSQTGGLPAHLVRTSRNIVATLEGISNRGLECVLVAHYDSYCGNANPMVSAPGANDNASGTSAVMEAARIARNYGFQHTLKFVAVSGEELGMYGSNHYARRARQEQRIIKGAVNADMIGYPTTPDTARLALCTYLTTNHLVDSALAVNERYGIGLTLAAELDNTGASDYGPFALMGFDALDIAEGTANEIWGGADPYYHSTADISANVRPSLVRRGAQLMLGLATSLAVPTERVNAVEPDQPALPQHFALEQNYPNPFNPTTVISSSVPTSSGREPRGATGAADQLSAASDVKLVVYDMLGREVAVLVNERRAAGIYQDTFSAIGLASGVYVYRLTTGSFVASRTMLLLK